MMKCPKLLQLERAKADDLRLAATLPIVTLHPPPATFLLDTLASSTTIGFVSTITSDSPPHLAYAMRPSQILRAGAGPKKPGQ